MLGLLADYDSAVATLDEGERRDTGDAALPALDAALARLGDDDEAAPLLRGFAARRLHDRGAWTDDAVATRLAANLSPGVPLPASAGWIEGFLGSAAHVLLHDPRLLGLVDEWLAGLDDDALVEALPLLRRATGGFGPHERQALLATIAGTREGRAALVGVDASVGAFAEGEALLELILGLGS
jgi:hypothetical protein